MSSLFSQNVTFLLKINPIRREREIETYLFILDRFIDFPTSIELLGFAATRKLIDPATVSTVEQSPVNYLTQPNLT